MEKPRKTFVDGGGEYEIIGKGKALLYKINAINYRFEIPLEAKTKKNKIYKIVGISTPPIGGKYFDSVYNMTFNESLEIYEVPTWLIFSCESIIFLPPSIKRVLGTVIYTNNSPKINFENNKFVTVVNKKNIINNHPLEIVIDQTTRSRIFIRETVCKIANYSFYANEKIISVVFPSSVLIIGQFSFAKCSNLRYVKFQRNSKLRRIMKHAFCGTAIENLILPSNLKIIDCYAFSNCKNLKVVSLPVLKKLNVIDSCAFDKSVEIK